MTEYRENPNPRKAYRLTMRIDDAPGPLQVIYSASQFDVMNRECLPPPDENPGGLQSPLPTEDVPIALTPVSENEYAGIVYLDGMIDEDYHGRGVCRWQLVQSQVQLKATGAEAETQFTAYLHRENFQSGETRKIYYWKGGYPRSRSENFIDFGETDRDKFKLELRDDLFTITLGAKEIAP